MSLLLGLIWISSATAGIKVAVFPFQDLTNGDNGVNWLLTEQFQHDLEEKGLDVLSRQAVISFMALHRIRTLGQLETYHISLAKKELGVDLIMLGTVCQSKLTPAPALTVALYLTRTTDNRTIWSNIEDICCIENRKLLGLNEPKSLEELSPMLRHNILATWPTDITAYTNKQKPLDIEKAWLHPTFVRSGQEIQCSAHMRNLWSIGNQPTISLKIGEKILPMKKMASEGFFETSWQAGNEEGRYPVSLFIQWPDGKKDISLIDSYFIDNQPPDIDLKLKGTEVEGKVTFDGRIIIMPRLRVREPITHWSLTFKNKNDKIMFTQETKGFPPAQLFWRGTDNNGQRFPNGDYQVTIKVWDRAENMAEASQWLTVHRQPPKIEVKATVVGQDLVIDLLHEEDIPVAFWQLKFRSANNVILKISEGNSFPAKILFPLSAIKEADKIIAGDITIQDILGNQTRKKIKNLLAMDTGEQEKDKDEAWTDEF